LIWGTRAARRIAETFDEKKHYDPAEVHAWYYPQGEEEIDPALINQDWSAIRNTMWNYAGIVRTPKRLERARADLDYLRHRIEKFYRSARMEPQVVGLKHGIQVAMLITQAACGNPVSRGAHFIHIRK
jgi:L-aspartate oxidase